MKTRQIKSLLFSLAGVMTVGSLYAEVKAPKISGFLDAQYQYKKKAIDPGFILNDGALYFSAEFDSVKGMIDLPFKGAVGENSSFDFAKGKAQAYLTWTAMEGLEISAGQFDTIFGFELNDSKDLTFTAPGAVSDYLLPVTHLGGMFAYSSDGLSLKALISNSGNKSQLYNTGPNPKSEFPEVGAQLGYSTDMLRASVGMLHHQQKGSPGASNFYSVLLGATFDPITVDAELDAKKIGSTAVGYGGLLNAVAKASDELSVGARFEWLRKVPVAGYEVINATFGPQYAFNENLKFKGDYTWTGVKPLKGDKRQNEQSVNAAALFMF